MPKATTVLQRLAACGLAVLAWTTTAQADETDWLYFPMNSRDTAHAVDLRALSWRPDGLLASATRYPRYSGETWTEEESRRGWYNYERRLIDCSLGFYVTTDVQLLGADGSVIASHPYTPQDWIESLQWQLSDSKTKPWPQRDEILLACSAASNPTLKKRRTQMARKVQPLLASKPITTDLAAESDALMSVARPHFVVNAPNQLPPTTAEAVFDRLRQQYAEWRKSVAGPTAAMPGPAITNREDVERKFNAYLQKESSGAMGGLRVLPGDVLEYARSVRAFELPDLSSKEESRAAYAESARMVSRLDCVSGWVLPISAEWRDDQGNLLLTKRMSAQDTARAVERANGEGSDDMIWDLRWGPRGNATLGGVLCRALARLKANAEPQDSSDDTQAALIGGLTAERLAQERTPEAMLFAIRTAWRNSVP